MAIDLSQSAPAVQTAVAGTSAVTILPAAGGDGVTYRDLVSLIITTANAVAGTLTVSDGTKTVFVLNYPDAALAPSTPLVLQFCELPVAQSKPNQAWTITASANASGYNVTAQYVERS